MTRHTQDVVLWGDSKTSRVKSFAVPLVMVVSLVAGACSAGGEAGGGETASTPSTNAEEAAPTDRGAGTDAYVLHEGGGWVLETIADPVPPESPDRVVLPMIRWRADYVPGSSPRDGDVVTVNGQGAPLAELEEWATTVGYELAPVEIGPWSGVAGIVPDFPAEPPTVLLDAGDGYTIHVYTYGLTLDELIDWAGGLTAVAEDEWRAARDEVADATPPE